MEDEEVEGEWESGTGASGLGGEGLEIGVANGRSRGKGSG